LNILIKNYEHRRTGIAGYGGSQEPSLQWILDTLNIPLNVGDDDPETNVLNSDPNTHNILLGDKVSSIKWADPFPYNSRDNSFLSRR
jgi:hypothetical protein